MIASPGRSDIRLPILLETSTSLSFPEQTARTCQQLIEFPPWKPEGDKQGFSCSVGRMSAGMQQLEPFE